MVPCRCPRRCCARSRRSRPAISAPRAPPAWRGSGSSGSGRDRGCSPCRPGRSRILVALDGGELVLGEVAGDVDVALLEQQALRGRLGDMAHDDALVLRRALVPALIGVERILLVGTIGADLVGAGAGRIQLEPAIAPVAVLLIGLDQLGVDDRWRRPRSGSSGRRSARRAWRP